LQSQPAHLGQEFSRRQGAVLNGGLDDGQKLALQRAVMPFGPFPKALHHAIRRILDRQVDGHGSDSAPKRMPG